MLAKKIIKQIQKQIQKQPEVLAVYCFGSFSKRKITKESDLDLAFVMSKTTTPDKIYNLIREISFPKDIDVSVVNKSSSPLFLYEIISGKRLYTTNEMVAEGFEAYVLKNYYDNAHIRNIYYHYLKDKFSL